MELCRKGHRHILKIFFNRNAADDGRKRLQTALARQRLPESSVECITSHSAALRYAKTPMGENMSQRCVDEAEMQRVILQTFEAEIQRWHGERPE